MHKKIAVLLTAALALGMPAGTMRLMAEEPATDFLFEDNTIVVMNPELNEEQELNEAEAADMLTASPEEEDGQGQAGEEAVDSLFDDSEIADLSAVPETETETEVLEISGFPQVGDVINGFEAVEIRPYESIEAQVVLFEHIQTGAKVIYIANDDVNRTFDLTFWTHAIDDTGLPHVFEHATLDGSEKYPSKSLFFNMIYQTYNTFMNAMTYDRMTTFPVASLSEAQLLKYADYYTDACFHPTIMEDESIFREEAWRYRMADEDSPLTMEGTVYSEMLGAVTLESAALQNFLSDAFPGSWIRFESGGNPDVIPEMTYDSLRAFHDRFYHPSNCTAFLYGSFENYAAFLSLLDAEFSTYESKEFVTTDEEYVPLEASVENTWSYPTETGSDSAYASTAYYGIVMPELTARDDLMKMDLLSSLLGASSSPLSQKLRTALPYAQLQCYLEMAGPDPMMVFSATNINEGDEQTFRDIVEGALNDLAENGISEELADAVESERVLSSRLRREGDDVGVSIIAYMAYNDVLYDDPWSAMDLEIYEENMDVWSRDGSFAALTSDYLIGDQITVLSATNPQPGAKEEKDAALAEKLQGIKDQMTQEEIDEIIASSNEEAQMDDASAYIRELQAVDVETLPEELPIYDISDETDETGLRHVETPAFVSEVGTVELFLDAKDLSLEDLKWMRLLTELQEYLDSQEHTREELAVLQQHYFYGGSVNYTIMRDQDKPHPYLTISWISLTDDLQNGYDLAYELAFEQAIDEEHLPQIKDAVQGLLAGRKSTITETPYSVIVYQGLARGDETMALSDACGNLNYYAFLQDAEKMLEEDPDALLAKLCEVRELLRNRNGAIAAYAGDEASFAANRELEAAFFDRLKDEEKEQAVYDLGEAANSYGLVVDSSVNYNGFAADFETLGVEGYDAGMEVVTSLVTDQFLYPLLRDQYGAYGAMNYAMEDAGMYMISYRDPNLEETYAVYEQLPDLLTQYPLDQETVDGYILSAYSGLVKSSGELSGALEAIAEYLGGKDQLRKFDWMEQMKAVTPETVTESAQMYENLIHNGVRISAGSGSVIRANSDLFEVVEAPFEK